MDLLKQEFIELCRKFDLDLDESNEYFKGLENQLTRLILHLAKNEVNDESSMDEEDVDKYLKEHLINVDIYSAILLNRLNVIFDQPHDLFSSKQESMHVPIIRAPIMNSANFNEKTSRQENIASYITEILNDLTALDIDRSGVDIRSLIRANKTKLMQKTTEIQLPLLRMWDNIELHEEISAEFKQIYEFMDGVIAANSSNEDLVRVIREANEEIMQYNAGFHVGKENGKKYNFKDIAEVLDKLGLDLQDKVNPMQMDVLSKVRKACLKIYNRRQTLELWEHKRDSDYVKVKSGEIEPNPEHIAKMLIEEMDDDPISESALLQLLKEFPKYNNTSLSKLISEAIDLIHSRDKLDAISQLMNLLDITSTKELMGINPNKVALLWQGKIDEREDLIRQNRLSGLDNILQMHDEDAMHFIELLIPTLVHVVYANLEDVQYKYSEFFGALGFNNKEQIADLMDMQKFVIDVLEFNFVVNYEQYREYFNKYATEHGLAIIPESMDEEPFTPISSLASTAAATPSPELIEEATYRDRAGTGGETPAANSRLNDLCAAPVYFIRAVQESILQRYNNFMADASKDRKDQVLSKSEEEYLERKKIQKQGSTTPKTPTTKKHKI